MFLTVVALCVLVLTLTGMANVYIGGSALAIWLLWNGLHVDFLLATFYDSYRTSYELGYRHGKEDQLTECVGRHDHIEYQAHLKEMLPDS